MLHKNFSLKNLTFLKTGGICNIFFEPNDIKDLQNFIIRNNNEKLLVLGAMSNVIIPDEGIRGSVIHLGKEFFKIEFLENDRVLIGAGTNINSFIKQCADRNISCIEEMYMIPGTIGGAIFMNAGTPIFEISDVILQLECLNMNNGKITIFDKNDLHFEYRKSNIADNFIITSCILKTKKEEKNNIHKRMKEILKKRKNSQPITAATCGSTFKNPTIGNKAAWQLIKSAGCQGLCVGKAEISNIHCNFIINKGGATSNDIIALINIVKKAVYEKHGIMLEEEIKIIR